MVMHRITVLLMTAALGLPLLGCFVVSRPPGATRAEYREPSCRPSQYWDGTMCRHKGQGRGARKHDGR
jgi:hypothetical protein